MKKYATNLIYLAGVAFVLAVVFKLAGVAVAGIEASTLLKATYALLLFAIAMAVA